MCVAVIKHSLPQCLSPVFPPELGLAAHCEQLMFELKAVPPLPSCEGVNFSPAPCRQ